MLVVENFVNEFRGLKEVEGSLESYVRTFHVLFRADGPESIVAWDSLSPAFYWQSAWK